MTYDRFLKIIKTLKKVDKTIDKLYDLNVDLMNFIDPYNAVIQELLVEIYGKEGYDWFSWFCYERDFGRRDKQPAAWDEKGNPICYSVESLWEFLEKNYRHTN